MKVQYLQGSPVRKLHIGCGAHVFPGWLNTDVHSRRGVLFLDARKHFPLPDANFDYVCSEHQIEHLTLAEARTMLRECARALKPGACCASPRRTCNSWSTSTGEPRTD